MPELTRQDRPEFFLVAHDEEPPVLRAIQLARYKAWVSATRGTPGYGSGIQIPGARIVQVMQRDVEQRCIDVHAAAAFTRLRHTREQTKSGSQTRHQIDDG